MLFAVLNCWIAWKGLSPRFAMMISKTVSLAFFLAYLWSNVDFNCLLCIAARSVNGQNCKYAWLARINVGSQCIYRLLLEWILGTNQFPISGGLKSFTENIRLNVTAIYMKLPYNDIYPFIFTCSLSDNKLLSFIEALLPLFFFVLAGALYMVFSSVSLRVLFCVTSSTSSN